MTADRRFSQAIHDCRKGRRPALVADIKPVSPRDGQLLSGRDAASLARDLVAAGACALSVVTETVNFGGSLQLLREVAAAVSVPVLRKDFVEDPIQIDLTLQAGGAALLFTLSTIPETRVVSLYRRAVSEGLEPVVEVHNEAQLRFALALEPAPTVIGINNRDVTQLEKDGGDVSVTERLAPLVPMGIVILSESALLTPRDVERAYAAGAHAVLVGTTILAATDPARRIATLLANVRI